MCSSEEPLIEDEEIEEEEGLLNNDDDDDVFSRQLKRVTINHGEFSEEEKRVADILLQLPELITRTWRPWLFKKTRWRPTVSPWLFKKTRSGINVLPAPPPSPRNHDSINDASKRLMQELHHLMEQRNILNLELKKVSTYQARQRAFNLLLKETTETSLQQDKNPKASWKTSNKLEVDLSPVLFQLGDEPPSAKIEAHGQNQERMVAGDEGSTSLYNLSGIIKFSNLTVNHHQSMDKKLIKVDGCNVVELNHHHQG